MEITLKIADNIVSITGYSRDNRTLSLIARENGVFTNMDKEDFEYVMSIIQSKLDFTI